MEMKMYDYLLTIRVPFKAMDDLEAKQITESTLEKRGLNGSEEIKLQRLVPGKPPVGVGIKSQIGSHMEKDLAELGGTPKTEDKDDKPNTLCSVNEVPQ